MNYLKRLTLSLTMTSVLAVTAFAGETSSPPCVPGETSSPPCAAQSVSDDSADPSGTLTPPAAPVVSVTDITEAVMWALSLF